ncbi:MAG TPA: co-chaperone GroES family protein [candidate division Zixibacteria bacterium]|nr:co-chaperone GroES family protein [candidate division Zixibacteria bacterium]HUU81185.1 co-chaperone GroES family protein [Acidobacteriota bacterium]
MTNKLPSPRGYKILIKKRAPKEVTSGGIILPDSVKDVESWLEICAQIVALGPYCYCDRDTGTPWPLGPWCKVGDWVIVPKFTQFKMDIEGEEYRFINDDEVIAVVDDPSMIKVYS